MSPGQMHFAIPDCADLRSPYEPSDREITAGTIPYVMGPDGSNPLYLLIYNRKGHWDVSKGYPGPYALSALASIGYRYPEATSDLYTVNGKICEPAVLDILWVTAVRETREEIGLDLAPGLDPEKALDEIVSGSYLHNHREYHILNYSHKNDFVGGHEAHKTAVLFPAEVKGISFNVSHLEHSDSLVADISTVNELYKSNQMYKSLFNVLSQLDKTLRQ